MFEIAVKELLQGGFICEFTHPAVFRWLTTEGNQSDVDAYLRRIGRRLTKTPKSQAFYAAWERVTQNERTEVKRVFSQIKQAVRPVVQFVVLCMDAEKKDAAPVPGDRLEFPALLKAVTDNAHLLEMLREICTYNRDFAGADSTPRGMLDKVIQQMERYGYLVLVNREREAYQFTGKIDYYDQVIDFLDENEGPFITESGDQEEQPEQGRLV